MCDARAWREGERRRVRESAKARGEERSKYGQTGKEREREREREREKRRRGRRRDGTYGKASRATMCRV